MGVGVPLQVSVVGFDGILLGDAIHPSLTTISISPRDMAQACVKALEYGKVNVNKRGLLLSVRGSLVVRESTAVAPTRNRA
jgi:DNA-binding LacI/PurR family transcriptional regulator